MVKVMIDNSYSHISGLSRDQEKQLRERLSYTVGEWGSAFGPQRKYLIDKKGYFPTGLLSHLGLFCLDTGLKPTVNDLRQPPSRLRGLFKASLPFSPYAEQTAAASRLPVNGRGTIVMPTGTGKSIVIALTIEALEVPTLIVVPSVELRSQLRETLKEIFDPKLVGGLGEAIAVENIDALDPKKVLKGYGALIVDESHHTAAKSYRLLNKTAWKDIYYRAFFTATPFRSQTEEQMLMESISGDVIYRLSYANAVKRQMICPIEAYYYDLPKVHCDGNTWSEVYSALVENRDDRNDLIATTMKSLIDGGKSVLCLVRTVRHGELLHAHLNALGVDIEFVQGASEDRSVIGEFAKGHRLGLIGTEGVVGEGVDTKACEYVIIAGLGKSKPAFMQKCGRSVRRYPDKETAKVILFRDRSHRFALRHFREQCKVLVDEYGVEAIKL